MGSAIVRMRFSLAREALRAEPNRRTLLRSLSLATRLSAGAVLVTPWPMATSGPITAPLIASANHREEPLPILQKQHRMLEHGQDGIKNGAEVGGKRNSVRSYEQSGKADLWHRHRRNYGRAGFRACCHGDVTTRRRYR